MDPEVGLRLWLDIAEDKHRYLYFLKNMQIRPEKQDKLATYGFGVFFR